MTKFKRTLDRELGKMHLSEKAKKEVVHKMASSSQKKPSVWQYRLVLVAASILFLSCVALFLQEDQAPKKMVENCLNPPESTIAGNEEIIGDGEFRMRIVSDTHKQRSIRHQALTYKEFKALTYDTANEAYVEDFAGYAIGDTITLRDKVVEITYDAEKNRTTVLFDAYEGTEEAFYFKGDARDVAQQGKTLRLYFKVVPYIDCFAYETTHYTKYTLETGDYLPIDSFLLDDSSPSAEKINYISLPLAIMFTVLLFISTYFIMKRNKKYALFIAIIAVVLILLYWESLKPKYNGDNEANIIEAYVSHNPYTTEGNTLTLIDIFHVGDLRIAGIIDNGRPGYATFKDDGKHYAFRSSGLADGQFFQYTEGGLENGKRYHIFIMNELHAIVKIRVQMNDEVKEFDTIPNESAMHMIELPNEEKIDVIWRAIDKNGEEIDLFHGLWTMEDFAD